MVKFSNNDSLIVCHGYELSIFYNTFSGEEIKRIPFNTKVHFFKNDENYIQLAPSRDKLIIYRTEDFKAIDTLEYDSLSIGDIVISKDEKKVIGIVSNGLREWDLDKHNIIKTKFYKTEEYQTSLQAGQISITNDNSKFIVTETREFLNPKDPENPYFSLRHNIYDVNNFDSIWTFIDKAAYRLSNTNKYIAFKRALTDYGVEIFDFNTGELVQKLFINGYSLTGIEFSPDDKYIVTSNGPGANCLLVWSIENGKEVHRYWPSSYECIDVSNNGLYVLGNVGNIMRLFKARFEASSVSLKEEIKKIIYPNPSNNIAIIEYELKTSANLTINLINSEGSLFKTILNKFLESGNQKIEINTSDIPSGAYFIVVQTEQKKVVFQLIVNH